SRNSWSGGRSGSSKRSKKAVETSNTARPREHGPDDVSHLMLGRDGGSASNMGSAPTGATEPAAPGAAGFLTFLFDPNICPNKDSTMLKEAPSVFHASDGAAYERWLGRWSSRLANAFLDFVKFPDEGELLDVGCGTGSLAMAMARRW